MTDVPEHLTPGSGQAILYVLAAMGRILLALAGMTLFLAPFLVVLDSTQRSSALSGILVVSGLGLVGIGLPVVAFLLARADWQSATLLRFRRLIVPSPLRLTEPRTLIRPLAYTALILTLGGAVTLVLALLLLGSAVALISPTLISSSQAPTATPLVFGPWTVSTLPEALLAAVIGAAVLFTFFRLAPWLAQAHARLALQWLTRPEQRLAEELSVTVDSRARLLRAFATESRRIERDLHDGVQPELLAISIRLGLALDALPADVPGREDVLRAQEQARQTLDVLRRFVRGIHPQVLVDHGLGAAIRELTDNYNLPINVQDELPGRLPAEVESNLYFCIAELLTNSVKHSGAKRAHVELLQTETGRIQITVQDDGRGGAVLNPGGGLQGVNDRVLALDGVMTVDSPLGGPTTVRLNIPVNRSNL